MVEHRDADHLAGLFEPGCQLPVFRAGGAVAGRMIVGADVSRGVHEDQGLVDFARVHDRQRQGADGDNVAADHAVFRVKAEDDEVFPVKTFEAGPDDPVGVGRCGDRPFRDRGAGFADERDPETRHIVFLALHLVSLFEGGFALSPESEGKTSPQEKGRLQAGVAGGTNSAGREGSFVRARPALSRRGGLRPAVAKREGCMSRPDGISGTFNEAADSLTGWREQQWEAMTKDQQKEYERMEAAERKRQRERADQFYKERDMLVRKEKNRLLLSRPELALRMLPGRLKERRAEYVASRNVQGRHEDEMRVMATEKMNALDGYMKEAEAERGRVREEKLNEKFTQALRGISLRKERDHDRGRER